MAHDSKTFQVVLHGEVSAKNITPFMERLRGLIGEMAIKEEIAYNEHVFAYDTQCANYIPNVPAYQVRARHILSGSPSFQGEMVLSVPPSEVWELRYLGHLERKIGMDIPNDTVQYRNVIAVSVSPDICTFLTTMGFRQTFSFTRFGTRWKRVNLTLEATRLEPLRDVNWHPNSNMNLDNSGLSALLIEIYSMTSDALIDKVSQEIRRFAMDLAPYFIEREKEEKEMSHSTATLAAEMRRKRPRD